MKFSEDRLKLFAAPLSETEDQKCKNAIGMVRDALKNLGFSDEGKNIEKMYLDTYSYSLEMRNATRNRKVKLFVKGSYANNTNVRTESDVDIAVVLESTFKAKYSVFGKCKMYETAALFVNHLPTSNFSSS